MTVCGKRNYEPGFFTSCAAACGHSQGCICGREVEAEEADETRGNE